MKDKTRNILSRIWKGSKWILLAGYLFITLGMVQGKKQEIPCREIATAITDSLTIHFVTTSDLEDLILNRYGKILGSPINRIVSKDIEQLARENPFISNAEVYKDINGVLHLVVSQRHPIARIVREHKDDVYLDREGMLLPSNGNKPVYILVVTGFTELKDDMVEKSVSGLSPDHPLRGVYKLSLFVDSSDFWKNQIEQIYVDRNREFWLAPRAGAHRILLGDADQYRWKFRKLYLLYTYGLNNLGWNQYETINLKYGNQIVCVKRKY